MQVLNKISKPDHGELRIIHRTIHCSTRECLQFADITGDVQYAVRESGIDNGLVNIQTRHTTTAILINENEPLLLEDMKSALERFAPQSGSYRHDDFSIRTVNVEPGEPANGHAHCKALFLRASETLNLSNGTIQLGRWQRIFLLELDRPRERTVSVLIVGF